MEVFRKMTVGVIIVFSAVAFFGCGAEEVEEIRTNAIVEEALPADAEFVMAVDYSDAKQINNFEAVKELFPDTGIKTMIIEGFNKEAEDEGMTYQQDIKPVVENHWKIAMAVNFSDKIKSLEDLENMDGQDLEIYIAAKFSQIEKAEDLIVDKIFKSEYGQELVYKEQNGIKYWTHEEDNFYLVRYGNIFVLTNQDEYRDEAVKGLRKGNGFELEKKFTSIEDLKGSNMGYMFLESDGLVKFAKNFYSSMGMSTITEMIEDVGDMYITFKMEKDGVRILSAAEFLDDKAPILKNYQSFESDLDEKVPAEGLIMYGEAPSLDLVMKQAVESFAYSYELDKAMLNGEAEEIEDITQLGDLVDDPEKYYQEFMTKMAESLDVSEDRVHDFMDNPYAMAVSNVDEFIPGIAFYLQVEEEDRDMAKDLVKVMDDYVDEVLNELDKLLANSGMVQAGVLKRDVAVVNGGTMSKVYLDWGAISQEVFDEFSVAFGMDLGEIKLEFYYGITGNNVFVTALYPNFDESYGKEVVADDPHYNLALKDLNKKNTGARSYFRMAPVFDFVDQYLDLLKDAGVVSEIDLVGYGTFENFVRTIKYMVSGARVEGDFILSEIFIKIEN